MKTSPIILTAASVLLQSQQAQASPLGSLTNLVSRGKADTILAIHKIFAIALPDNKAATAWDYRAYPTMCEVYMETKDGGNCKASVTCDDGTMEYLPKGAGWNACFVGGRQYFTDPRIGDFSITFQEKDGAGQGEGLTTPNLQVKSVGNWQEIPVNDLAEEYNTYTKCNQKSTGTNPFLDCVKGPYVCKHGDFGNNLISDSRTKKWHCGIPKGSSSGGHRPGACGLHVIQYQKPDPSRDSYALEITRLNDANELKIGGVGKSGPKVSLGSKLPWTVEVSTGDVDTDPVYFAYGSQFWNSNDKGKCKVGAYDHGKREMDCGFTCD